MPKNLTVLANQLQKEWTPSRLSFTGFNQRKTFTSDQKAKAASIFDADDTYVSASKKLYDTKHPAYKALTAAKNKITEYWTSSTQPYPQDGIRFLPNDELETFETTMKTLRQGFLSSLQELAWCFEEVKAKNKLGQLFAEDNYPSDPLAHFGVEWSYPSIEPAQSLKSISPKIYEQEKVKIQDQMKAAVLLAQEAFTKDFADLISHLAERLTPGSDGKMKVLHGTTVTNIHDFIEKFEKMSLGSSDQLETLVKQTKDLIYGTTPEELRDLDVLKSQVKSGLDDIAKKLEPMISVKPRRKIITPTITPEVNHAEAVPT